MILNRIIDTIRSKNDKSPCTTVTVFDHGKTLVEVFEQGVDALLSRPKGVIDKRMVQIYRLVY